MLRSIRITSLEKILVSACLALCTLGVAAQARAQGASVESASADQKKTAQKAFEAGMKASKAGKHDDALQAFRDSYGAVASPNSHLMVARELVELGRLEEAWAEYDKCLTEAEAAAAKDKKYEGAVNGVKSDQADLAKKLGFLKLNVSGTKEGDRVTVRGREIPQSDWVKPIPVAPGSVQVTLVANDGKETTKEVTATAGSDTPVDLSPASGAPATAPDTSTHEEAHAKLDTSSGNPSLRTWAYVAGGVGVAGIATFAVFGLMSNSKHSKLQDNCPNNQCPANLKDDADAGKRYQTIANIGLVVGVVGLGTGTVLYLVSSGGNKEKAAKHEPPRRGPHIDNVNLGYQSVSVSGSF